MREVLDALYSMQDISYRDFTAGLIPHVEKECIIGVRTPKLRAYAKTLWKTGQAEEFLSELPHRYFEENQLHAFLLEGMTGEELYRRLTDFLPYVDNWATCDQCSPKCFAKQPPQLPQIRQWISDEHTYTVRFGLHMLMQHYLTDRFAPEILTLAMVDSEEYYIRMMVAWFFATALYAQYEQTLPVFEKQLLPVWTHNKAIQKAVESRRIPEQRKAYLRSLKRA